VLPDYNVRMADEPHDDPRSEALRFVERFRGNLMRGLWAVLTGDAHRHREARREFEALFPKSSVEELARAEADTPEHLRWWAAEPRDATPDEADVLCRQCKRRLGDGRVKQCPNCGVVLHAACYDDSRGGYETLECEACRFRCYTR